MQRLILCINRRSTPLPHQRVSHIGGIHPDGRHWKLTLEEAILAIESGERSFTVLAPNHEVFPVVIARDPNGSKYLKATADRDQPESLLNLPDCHRELAVVENDVAS